MGLFDNAFKNIADGIEDVSSLEVVTYSGKIELKGNAQPGADFTAILKQAKASSDFKILAATKSHIDGDVQTFLDNAISAEQWQAHNDMVEVAKANRKATFDMIKDALMSRA